MNGKRRMQKTISRSLMFMGMMAWNAAAGAADGPLIWGQSPLPPPFHVPHYIGTIYPVPQDAVYHDDLIPLRHVAVVTGRGIGADDPRIDLLRARIVHFGGSVAIVANETDASAEATLIVLGETAAGAGVMPPEREQGYVIEPREHAGRAAIVLKGFDQQGLLWAIMSLNQLMTVRAGAPAVRRAEVRDYPEHPLRGFKAGGWHRHDWHPAQRVRGGPDIEAQDRPDQDGVDESDAPEGSAGDGDGMSVSETISSQGGITAADLEGRAWYVLNAKMNYVVLGGFQPARRPQRGNWRKPQPEFYLDVIRRTGELLTPLGIQWYSGYNPCPRARVNPDMPEYFSRVSIEEGHEWGAGIDTAVEEDYQIILRDARTVAAAGGGFFLAFDDYRFGLLRKEQERFGSAREADHYFLSRLFADLRGEFPDVNLLFCPPFYWGPRGGIPPSYGESREMYLERIGTLPRDIDIFWTGPRVGASRISEENREWTQWIYDLIARRPVFWQNLSTHAAIPRNPRYYYPPDIATWWSTAFYDGFYHEVKAYIPNCPMSMPDYAIGAMTLSDYLWNPDAYDAERSAREATMMMLGPEAYPAVAALRDALDYFVQYNLAGYNLDRAGFERAAADIAGIRRMVQEVEQRWQAALEAAPEIVRWSAMRGFAARPRQLPGRIERRAQSDLVIRDILRDAEDTFAAAVAEAGMDPDGDILLPADSFAGGVNERTPPETDELINSSDNRVLSLLDDPRGGGGDDDWAAGGGDIFSLLSERRPTVWLSDRSASTRSIHARFYLAAEPAADRMLLLCGQEKDPGPAAMIRVFINDELLYEGAGGFPRHDWGLLKVPIPVAHLRARRNVLRIENAGEPPATPRFYLNYAVVRQNEQPGEE